MSYAEFIFIYIGPISSGLIILFNIITIYFIIKNKKSKKKTGVDLVLNLAFSDLFVGVTMAMLMVLSSLKDKIKSEALDITINITLFLLFRVSLFASMFNLMALTLLRYYGINNPFKYRLMLAKYITKICITIWTLSLTIASGFFCLIHFNVLSMKYLDFILSVVVFMALLCFLILNYYIRKFTKIRSSSNIELKNHNKLTAKSSNNSINKRNRTYKKMSFEDNIKWYVICSTIGFFIFWIPLSLYGIAQVAGYVSKFPFDDIGNTVFILALWNSIFNPVVYLFILVRRYNTNKNNSANIKSEAY